MCQKNAEYLLIQVKKTRQVRRQATSDTQINFHVVCTKQCLAEVISNHNICQSLYIDKYLIFLGAKLPCG